MGLLWEMHQQGQSNRRTMQTQMATASLEQRVEALEKDNEAMNQLLDTLITKLEAALGTDLDGDGKVPLK